MLRARGRGARGAPSRPRREVERLANDAVNAYKGADYKRAVELLQKAYEIRQVPALLYNMAKAYDKLGDIDHAYDAYHLYADSAAADPKLKARAEQRVAALAEASARRRRRRRPADAAAARRRSNNRRAPPPVNLEPTLQPPPTIEEQHAQAHDEFVAGKKRDRLIATVLGGATVAFARRGDRAVGRRARAREQVSRDHVARRQEPRSSRRRRFAPTSPTGSGWGRQ